MAKRKRYIIVTAVAAAVILFFIFCSMLAYNGNIAIVKVSESSQLNQKIKTALLKSGSIELTEPEANGIIDMVLSTSGKYKEKISDAYINIEGSQIRFSGIIKIKGLKFYISSLISPGMLDGNINLKIENLYIGRVKVPKGIALKLLKRCIPGSVKVLGDGSIDIGSKILLFDIRDISIGNDKIMLVFKMGQTGQQDNSISKSGNANPTSTPTPSKSKEDSRVSALKKTNRQLYAVQKSVDSQAAKNWVGIVISVNARMIENPDGNYSSDIKNAKSIYTKLPESDRNQIKEAALNNMDIASVRFLYNEYGL